MSNTLHRGLAMACALGCLSVELTRGGELEFVVIGDTRPTFESENFHRFESLIPKINATRPALVINLGDLIYGYAPLSKEKQWDKYQQTAAGIQAPYYQLPGNHDTHSKEARKVYGRRFGAFYRSFEQEDCLFVLLDNTEQGRWGYLGPEQFEWLKQRLTQTHARSVFVFMHFPVWEPERVTPQFYQFWAEQLHPLFKQSRVRGVFAGHYHSYGPTREFDGIRYFITGGGGAELRPEYSEAGGDFHFMRVKTHEEDFQVRVVTRQGELSDAEADVMGGLQFAERHTTRIGIKNGAQFPTNGIEFSVTITNPYAAPLVGKAQWVFDRQAFSLQPATCIVEVPVKGIQRHRFLLKTLAAAPTLESLPRLEFYVAAGSKHHQFHREVRFLDELTASYLNQPPCLDGNPTDWPEAPCFKIQAPGEPAPMLRCAYDRQNLYLALTVPRSGGAAEAEEFGFRDDLQLGFARRLNDTDFGPDFLRLGFSAADAQAQNRTPGRHPPLPLPGVRSVCSSDGTSYEMAIPLRLLKPSRPDTHPRLVLNLAFPLSESAKLTEPTPNTFSHRVRYGMDSLVPVHFVELALDSKFNPDTTAPGSAGEN